MRILPAKQNKSLFTNLVFFFSLDFFGAASETIDLHVGSQLERCWSTNQGQLQDAMLFKELIKNQPH